MSQLHAPPPDWLVYKGEDKATDTQPSGGNCDKSSGYE